MKHDLCTNLISRGQLPDTDVSSSSVSTHCPIVHKLLIRVVSSGPPSAPERLQSDVSKPLSHLRATTFLCLHPLPPPSTPPLFPPCPPFFPFTLPHALLHIYLYIVFMHPSHFSLSLTPSLSHPTPTPSAT